MKQEQALDELIDMFPQSPTECVQVPRKSDCSTTPTAKFTVGLPVAIVYCNTTDAVDELVNNH